MYSPRSRRTAGLWCVCAAACLAAVPALAQTPAPTAVPASALSPIQGAREALARAHRAKNLGELNGSLTNESAAGIGFGLVLADSLMSGMAATMTDALTPKGMKPKGLAREEASEKAFQDKVEALLKRYSLDAKTPKGADKPDMLPPSLIACGHQFLADALVLSDAYEKSHAPSKGGGTLGSQISGSDLPAPEACDFHVFSPTRVRIVARARPKLRIEACLEDGQWRLDAGAGPSSSAPARPKKTIAPQGAAFLKAIKDSDEAAVRRELKANPSLANSRPDSDYGASGSVSGIPLLEAVFWNDPNIIALLLKYGANVSTENDFGENALDKAVRFNYKDTVVLLLAHGAKVGHKDRSGSTALHIAAQGSSVGIATLLLAHGADVNARDKDGKTPLAVALASNNSGPDHIATINLLRRHGARK